MMPLIMFLMAVGCAQIDQTTGPTVVISAPKTKPHTDTTLQVDDESNSEQYGPIWPTKAYDHRVGGKVILNCMITNQGFAQACRIVSEDPDTMGFGAAALQIQPSLKLPPPASSSVSGPTPMNISVNFDPPNDVLGASRWSSGPIGSIGATSGSAISSRTGNPIIMRPVTMMNHPLWLTAPNFEDMRRAYPARGAQTEGFVVLRCAVERAGNLSRCDASKEAPVDLGFAKAALSLAPLFRISPDVMSRAPRDASIQVVVPIRFAPYNVGVQPTITSPSWISGFDLSATPKLFPPEAVARGLTTGRGVARCVVGPDGSLRDCSPGQGDPDQTGFSEAAVVLAQTMKMSLWSGDAGPVTGGIVMVTIRLNLVSQK